ncbi:MAG: glycosyltransferase family 39 protein, partial [Anaerolineales bacterium]|nr:glycosyltransferase family 39 protein [Anaerolineales bacterium]
TGYDAWSVLHYGIDRNGFLFPMMFKSWGSGMYALSGYLAWPFMLVGGLNAITIRLPHLVLGIVSLVALYKLTLQCVNRRTALIAMFLLAINPWHIMISRWGLDSNIFPSFFLFSTAVFVLSLKKHKYMPYSAALFALCLYTYGTAYVVVPVFLLLAGIALWKHWHIPKKIIGISAAVFTAISMPVVLFVLINQFNWSSIELPFFSIPAMTTARFQTVSTVFGGDLHDILKNLRVLWELLITQNDDLPWNQIVPYGTMYPFGFFLSFYGVIAATFTAWKKRGAHPIVFLLIWLFAAVVLSTMQPVNINRINIIYIPLVFFMAYGIQNITQRNKLALTSIITVCVLYFGSFTHTYFTQYPAVIGEKFYEGLGKSISIASQRTSDAVCVTDKANMPY